MDLKKYVSGSDFSWFYQSYTTDDVEDDVPYYGHKIIARPSSSKPYSEITSPIFPQVYNVLKGIFEFNDMECKIIYRLNFNCMFSVKTNIEHTPYHQDMYDIPHKNLIVYMSNFEGGHTYIKEDGKVIKYKPSENKIILFGGDCDHSMTPTIGANRRIVLVACFA